MKYSNEQIAEWKRERLPDGECVIVWKRHENLETHLSALKLEFAGQPRLCFELISLIVRIRRQNGRCEEWEVFRSLLQCELDYFCEHLDSRWLVAVADTLADLGEESERAAAMLSSLLINVLKLAETERMFSVNPEPDPVKFQKFIGDQMPVPLWDGVSSYWVDRGDMPRNLLHRCRSVLEGTPIPGKIFETLIRRLELHPNPLTRLAKYNPHFWQ